MIDPSSQIPSSHTSTQQLSAPQILTNFLNNSKCATDQQQKEYLNKLLGNKKLITILLFRGSKHGWMAKDFHSRCNKKSPTISLFKIKNGDCIGGFTKAQWSNGNGDTVEDSETFVFNLSSYRQFNKNGKWGIKLFTESGPYFANEYVAL